MRTTDNDCAAIILYYGCILSMPFIGFKFKGIYKQLYALARGIFITGHKV